MTQSLLVAPDQFLVKFIPRKAQDYKRRVSTPAKPILARRETKPNPRAELLKTTMKMSAGYETSPSLQDPDAVSFTTKGEYRTYLGRYYVLIVAALLCMQQNLAWLTFGPIPQEAKDKYGLTDIEITLLSGSFNSRIAILSKWYLINGKVFFSSS